MIISTLSARHLIQEYDVVEHICVSTYISRALECDQHTCKLLFNQRPLPTSVDRRPMVSVSSFRIESTEKRMSEVHSCSGSVNSDRGAVQVLI